MGTLPLRYFDDQGSEVKVGSPSSLTEKERARILYVVNVRVSRAKTVPAANAGTVVRLGSRNLTVLTIQVVTDPAGITLPLTAELLVEPTARGIRIQTFPAIVARISPVPP